jgi:hypothetical protein
MPGSELELDDTQGNERIHMKIERKHWFAISVMSRNRFVNVSILFLRSEHLVHATSPCTKPTYDQTPVAHAAATETFIASIPIYVSPATSRTSRTP